MQKNSPRNQYFLFVKKFSLAYLHSASILVSFVMKPLLFLIYHSSRNPFRWVYALCVILGTCDRSVATSFSLLFSSFATFIFICCSLITIFYNNKFFIPIIESVLGADFSKKYLPRSPKGYYIYPFIMISLIFFLPFLFDLVTNSIDHAEQLVEIDKLAKIRSQLFAEGRVEESREVARQLLALTKIKSKGFFTKVNIILFS